MKKENGASSFFSNFNDRIEQSVENAQNTALDSAVGQDAGNLIRERRDVQGQFNKFNTAAKENTNPFGNLASIEASDKQGDINQLTGEIGQSIALNNAQNKVTDATNNAMDQANRANPFKPNNNNNPKAGPPMSNGTGSGRPNFDAGASMNIKKVNEGTPMSNVLFKKK
tara:strand:+ start:54 stop:560 length:507 start_codon:yes stop_codon:yes gene_type:complete